MDPEQLARLAEALEAQHRWIAGLRSRWDVARRIPPGHSTFWAGPARLGYEAGVGLAHAQALLVSDALAAALAHTRAAIGSVRPG
jgi:hypothetical protein